MSPYKHVSEEDRQAQAHPSLDCKLRPPWETLRTSQAGEDSNRVAARDIKRPLWQGHTEPPHTGDTAPMTSQQGLGRACHLCSQQRVTSQRWTGPRRPPTIASMRPGALTRGQAGTCYNVSGS